MKFHLPGVRSAGPTADGDDADTVRANAGRSGSTGWHGSNGRGETPGADAGYAQRADPGEEVTWPMRVAAAWTWRLLVIGTGLYVLGRIFDRIELVAFSFILALFFTAILHPLELMVRRGVHYRSASALITLLIGLGALVGIAYFVTWQISTHSTQLADQFTAFVNKFSHWLQTGPLHLKSGDIDKITTNVTKTIKDHQSQLISGAIQTVQTVIEALGAILLILLSTFFLLKEGERIWQWTVRLLPHAAQSRVDRAGHAGWRTVGGYMRGQVIIAVFHGTAVTILLLILKVPLAAALGVLIFLGSFIPLIGLTVAGAMCCAAALLEHGYGAAIAVGVVITVLVQLEAHVLQPLIMSRNVHVHPLAIALSVITGTILAGIVGALLAVPFVAFLNSTVQALRGEPELPEPGTGFPVAHTTGLTGKPVDGTKPTAQEADAARKADEADASTATAGIDSSDTGSADATINGSGTASNAS